MITELIRARIIELRKQNGFTQEALAEKIGIDPRNYKRLEGGHKKIIDPDLPELLAEALGVSLLDLLPLEKLGLGNNLKTPNGIREEQQNLQSIIDEIRANYDAATHQLRSAFEEHKQLSAEKDNLIQHQHKELGELRKIVEELKENFRK